MTKIKDSSLEKKKEIHILTQCQLLFSWSVLIKADSAVSQPRTTLLIIDLTRKKTILKRTQIQIHPHYEYSKTSEMSVRILNKLKDFSEELDQQKTENTEITLLPSFSCNIV